MKKIYMSLLIMMISLGVSAQCFIYEGFDAGMMPPAGWTISGIPDQWTVSSTDNSGGTIPEGKFSWIQQTANTKLISPMMDLTGLTSVKLSFRHFYDDYSGAGPKLGVSTRSHNGTWSSVWEINPTSNVGPELREIIISNTDVGQTEFQFCIYLDGNMYNIDYWYVDNILFYNPLQTNAAALSIETPKYLASPAPVFGKVMNVGLDIITSLEMAWQLDNGQLHTQTFSGLSLATEDTYEYSFTDLLDTFIGDHVVKVWITKVNGNPDNDMSDDTLYKDIVKVSYSIPRLPIFEEFTSSTCAPCAQFNTGFVPWCQEYADSITLLKYQMDWPAPGDPYYTEEGGVRRDFYGVGFVPDLYCNGSAVATDMSMVQASFDGAVLQPGLLDISTSWSLDNEVITITATVLPFTDFGDALINIGVFEEVTYNNTGSNGETEFHHVMMKMIPDGYGTTTNLTDRQPFTISQIVDLSTTFMERWDDVGVVVFIQDQASKEIYQSEYGLQNAVFSTEARLSNIMVDGTAIEDFDPDIFEYDYTLASGSTIVPDVEGVPMTSGETVIVIPAINLPGATTIDVFAEDLSVKNTYTVNFDWPLGSGDRPGPAVNIYPNPTHGKVIIAGAAGAEISVVNSNGIVVYQDPSFDGTTIDLSGFAKGVYLLNLNIDGKNPVHKRIVVY